MNIVITAVLPVFALIALGNIVGRLPFFPVKGVAWLIRYVWYIAMPIAVYNATVTNPLPTLADAQILIAYFIPLGITFWIATAIGRRSFAQNATENGLYGYAACFSNIIYMGLPIVAIAFGAEGIRLLILIVGVHEFLLISMTMFTISLEGNIGTALTRSIKRTLKIPLIIAIILGILSAYVGYRVPSFIDSVFSLIGPTAGPTGLFAVGASLVGVKAAGDRHQAMVATGLKLFTLPLLVFISATLWGLSGQDIAILTLIASLPTGLNAFNLATQMKTAERRAATIILYATSLSLVTVSGLLFLSH